MKLLLNIARGLVGGTFIVSGLVKANDILGFSYKLDEYFEPGALGWTIFADWSVELSALVCISEIILGAFLLLNIQKKWSATFILLMSIFFGWLTLHTATCDPNATKDVIIDGVQQTISVQCVNDCGCFGDAMKDSLGRSLTPWESFIKDLVLLILVLPIVLVSWRSKNEEEQGRFEENYVFTIAFLTVLLYAYLFSWPFLLVALLILFVLLKLSHLTVLENMHQWFLGGAVVLFTVYFAHHTYHHLPLKDFRAYKVGANILEGMKSCEELGKPCPEFGTNYLLKNTETMLQEEVPDSVYMSDEKYWSAPYEFVASNSYVKKYGYEPTVTDFELSTEEGIDLTQEILNLNQVHLVIAYDAEHSHFEEEVINELNRLMNQWKSNNEAFYFVSGSAKLDFNQSWLNEVPFVYADGTTLKTIIRSHPGIITLKKGTVVSKTHFNDFKDLK